jgi:hypothetical protein
MFQSLRRSLSAMREARGTQSTPIGAAAVSSPPALARSADRPSPEAAAAADDNVLGTAIEALPAHLRRSIVDQVGHCSDGRLFPLLQSFDGDSRGGWLLLLALFSDSVQFVAEVVDVDGCLNHAAVGAVLLVVMLRQLMLRRTPDNAMSIISAHSEDLRHLPLPLVSHQSVSDAQALKDANRDVVCLNGTVQAPGTANTILVSIVTLVCIRVVHCSLLAPRWCQQCRCCVCACMTMVTLFCACRQILPQVGGHEAASMAAINVLKSASRTSTGGGR